jgi:hypothetical protein
MFWDSLVLTNPKHIKETMIYALKLLMMKMSELLKLPLDVSYEHFAIRSHIKCDCYTISFLAVLYHLLCQGYQHLEAECWVLSYKHTDPSWPHILGTIQLQQSDYRFRYPLYCLLSLPSVETVALCRSVMKDGGILCSYKLIHIVMSETLDSHSDVTTTPTCKQFRSVP